MFEKEIILKEQLAARCLLQCSPARKSPADNVIEESENAESARIVGNS
jgi:hypothetical protein